MVSRSSSIIDILHSISLHTRLHTSSRVSSGRPASMALQAGSRTLVAADVSASSILRRQMASLSRASTTPFARSYTLLSSRRSPIAPRIQQRNLSLPSWPNNSSSANNSSRNLLASLEATANAQPSNATAQNAFYQALLRANMPEILVERYQTGRYASNVGVEGTYLRALERMGGVEGGAATQSQFGGGQGQGQGMRSEQFQAIGQAISARNQGGNVSISKAGSGARSEPLYVVVDESLGSTIFKWVKFVLVFGLVTYSALVLFTIMIEATALVKKVGSGADKETKPELQTTKFSDVHGCDEAKEELQELVEFLKAPESFSTLGGKLPKGVLLVGPPGTGKTLLARAVAGEAGVPFFYMSGSEFDEVYVGVGAKRVRDLFASARAKSPSIIFIDELDAVGGKRSDRDAAYAKQTLNQLLTELDGFTQETGVIILAATNFPQNLDKALTRPGRFDRNIRVDLPDVRGRVAILAHHMRKIKFSTAVDVATLARGTPGLSGAELENVVNQAAVRASKNKSATVGMDDLEWAKDKVIMGAENRSMVIQPKDRVMTARHEAGHALVAMLTEGSTPLYKATIMPRGHALGMTMSLPEMDVVSTSKREMEAQIDVCMGGKVAEEMIYGKENVTTGASSDITNATRTAYSMVTRCGFSDKLGNVDLASDYRTLSAQTKSNIEDEVRRFVDEGTQRVMKLLTDNREGLERLASALVEYETLGRAEMEAVVRGEKLPDRLKSDVQAPIKMPDGGPMITPAGGLGLPGFEGPPEDEAHAEEERGEKGPLGAVPRFK